MFSANRNLDKSLTVNKTECLSDNLSGKYWKSFIRFTKEHTIATCLEKLIYYPTRPVDKNTQEINFLVKFNFGRSITDSLLSQIVADPSILIKDPKPGKNKQTWMGSPHQALLNTLDNIIVNTYLLTIVIANKKKTNGFNIEIKFSYELAQAIQNCSQADQPLNLKRYNSERLNNDQKNLSPRTHSSPFENQIVFNLHLTPEAKGEINDTSDFYSSLISLIGNFIQTIQVTRFEDIKKLNIKNYKDFGYRICDSSKKYLHSSIRNVHNKEKGSNDSKEKNHSKVDNIKSMLMFLSLPKEYRLGKIPGEKGSFFKALAQAMNAFDNNNNYTEKELRKTNYQYYRTHSEEVKLWDNKDYLNLADKAEGPSPISTLDIILERHSSPPWVNIQVAGRILCNLLKKKGILLIKQSLDENKTHNCLIISSCSVELLDEKRAKLVLLETCNFLILLATQEKLQFIPLLPDPTFKQALNMSSLTAKTEQKIINNKEKKALDHPLYRAAHDGDLTQFNTLLQQTEDSLWEEDHKEQNCLFYAIRKGRIELVEFLLDKKLKQLRVASNDITLKEKWDKFFARAFIWAVDYCRLDIARLLSNKGEADHIGIKKFENPLLHELVFYRNTHKNVIDMIDLLLQKGFCVNDQSRNGATPLHVCAQKSNAINKRNSATITHLLFHQSNIEAKDNTGRTPLHIAASVGKASTLKFLLKQGANINAQDNNKDTAFTLAIKSSKHRTEKIKLLLQYRAEIRIRKIIGLSLQTAFLSFPNVAINTRFDDGITDAVIVGTIAQFYTQSLLGFWRKTQIPAAEVEEQLRYSLTH